MKNLSLLSVLITGVGSILTAPVAAQTFTTLHSFTTTPTSFPYVNSDGRDPQAGLLLSGNTLYGAAVDGGSSGWGTVFAVNTDGTGFTTLHSFSAGDANGINTDGILPQAGLILSGTTLYGTANAGGSSGNGTVFAVNTDGSRFTNLWSFTATAPYPNLTNGDGVGPYAALSLSGNTLYGTTSVGGTSGSGTVFAVNTNGTGFTNLHSFSATDTHGINTDGAYLRAGLLLSGNTLYGTAGAGGNSGNGTVFKVNTDGTGFRTLHHFTAGTGSYPSITNSDGANPYSGLILSGNTLYGTAYGGGSGSVGTVFAVNTDGTGFAILHDFTAFDLDNANGDGALPFADLSLSGHTLYGATLDGGRSGEGTVFSLNTDGTGFTTVYTFTKQGPSRANSDGAGPFGLMLSGNTLYGAAAGGGTFGNGTVFSVTLPITSPQLTLALSGATVILTWPTNFTGFTLQSTTNLVSPFWTTNLPAPAIVNGRNTVANPSSDTQQFFRLSQ